ncbi:NIPSNAP family protein [Prolixibacter sp. SD074]|uniref:NIPSNAP family protein n=1 Tax=Prolixibacter sp. SD074 TaxID=2652391 RepID=UPI00126F7AD8|nr:NIPSNAP family protein [Prolixibacter sp. SD074]GET29630.1 hypothetical protein SD074_18320 [Prolixibacter sp. SD074]
MKRRNFLRSAMVGAAGTAVSASVLGAGRASSSRKQFYELRDYELVRSERQEFLDQYFRYALIPALNRAGIEHVGVFSEIQAEHPARILLLIPYNSGKDFFKVKEEWAEDETFRKAAQKYNSLPADNYVYSRYTTYLLEAFSGFPEIKISTGEPGIFELRNYQSYSEDAGRRKIEMFNREELALFNEVGLSPLFFGKVLAGDTMPSLTYMLSFNNMEERDALWKKFGESEGWKQMEDKPEYANTVSEIVNRFYEPLSYSQI